MSEANRTTQYAVMPRWFRRAVMLGAALSMCSCAAAEALAAETCPAGDSSVCESSTCPTGGCAACECPPGWPVGPADEYLCDGGDRLSPAGVTRDERFAGLEQEDTVGVYTTADGRILVAPSTRTCIYAPRFAAVRHVVQPMGALQRDFVDAVGDAFAASESELALQPDAAVLNAALRQQRGQHPPSLFIAALKAGATERLLAAAETRGLVAPAANLQLVEAGVIEGRETPVIARHSLAAITWTGDQEVQVTISADGATAVFDVKQPGLIYELGIPNSPRLRLVKLASTDEAHPGDEVTFTLRFDNVGDAPMKDVVIVDNLTTRLEYVEESAESSLDAEFTTARNDAGSLVLRWALEAPLEPGDGGVLTFRTRVR